MNIDHIYNPRNISKYKGPQLEYLIIIYGSKPGDPLDDSRFGAHQRRAEITLRLPLPRKRMSAEEIKEFAHYFTGFQWQDVKHTNFWHCEFCDKPTRVSKVNLMSWAHLRPPRVVAYVHLMCNNVKGKCAKALRELDEYMSLTIGAPLAPPLKDDHIIYPLASACAGCQMDSSVAAELPRCGHCRLVRYCSAKCELEDRSRHEPFCKAVKEVKWIPDEAITTQGKTFLPICVFILVILVALYLLRNL